MYEDELAALSVFRHQVCMHVGKRADFSWAIVCTLFAVRMVPGMRLKEVLGTRRRKQISLGRWISLACTLSNGTISKVESMLRARYRH